MTCTSETEDRRNFDKLDYVCKQAVPQFLRGVFYEVWKVVEGTEWEDKKWCGLKLAGTKGVGGIIGRGKKLQKKNVECGNSLLWDLSLLADLLKVLIKANPSIVLLTCDLSQFTTKNLETLKSTRNKLAHSGSIEMDSVTFQPLWNDTLRILTLMGMERGLLERPVVASEETHKTSEGLSEVAKKAEDLKLQGNDKFKAAHFLEAVVLYTEGIQLEGVPVELLGTLYSNRSVGLLEAGDIAGAKDDAKSCITLRPSWFRGYTRLGQAYEKLRKFSKAVLNFNFAIYLGDTSKKTLDSLVHCKLMSEKLKRSEHTDPDLLKQKSLTYSLSQSVISELLGPEQANKYLEMGTEGSIHLCRLGFCYNWGRDGYPQDYERAAEYFSKAASMGNAEGLYNLGCMTEDGKGVMRDVFKGHQLFLQAASKPPIMEVIPGSGIKCRNVGVMEASHAIGMAYDFGGPVDENPFEALRWYHVAIEYGSGLSANNIAIIYNNYDIECFPKAVEYWKLSAYLECVRGMENLTINLWQHGRFEEAQEWFHYALSKGSTNLKDDTTKYVRSDQLERSFDPQMFALQLEKDLRDNSSLSALLEGIEAFRSRLTELRMNPGGIRRPEFVAGRSAAILRHRESLKKTKEFQKKRHSVICEVTTTAPPKLLPTSSTVDLVGLKEIFFKGKGSESIHGECVTLSIWFAEMEETKEDRVFTGRVLKLSVIEDAVLGNPSVYLLVEDGSGDVGRLFVYNYPQRNETHEEIGYGTRLSLIYPHYRTMNDGLLGLRVDDPLLVFRHPHLRNPDRCRYCGKADGGQVPCSKCGRVKYCSKLCLMKDAEELNHAGICFNAL